jgi:hypothetical protein
MENCRKPGYVTEKIMNAFHSGAVPVYWGSEEVARFFNKRAFVDASDFPDLFACVRFVLNMPESERLAMLREPILTLDPLVNSLRPGQSNSKCEEIVEFIRKVIEE